MAELISEPLKEAGVMKVRAGTATGTVSFTYTPLP